MITSTGSAEAVDGAKYFKTVTSVVCSAQYAGNITVGSQAGAAQAVFTERMRLKGFSLVSGGTAGVIQFYNNTPEDGSVLFKSRTVGTDNTTVDRTIPEDGILFPNGMVVQYTVATIDMMTFFYA